MTFCILFILPRWGKIDVIDVVAIVVVVVDCYPAYLLTTSDSSVHTFDIWVFLLYLPPFVQSSDILSILLETGTKIFMSIAHIQTEEA